MASGTTRCSLDEVGNFILIKVLSTDIEKIMGDFWVIVNSLGTGHPRAYILLPHEVRDLADRDRGGKRAYWLPLKQYAVDAFEEQWQRIGQPLSP